MAIVTEPTVEAIETQKNQEEDEEEDSAAAAAAAAPTGAEDEDTGAQIAPIVNLQEVPVFNGEEDEDVLLDMKAKLYRFDNEGTQWKERGVGTVRLLKHKITGKVRILMRQSKTLKICANHIVTPSISLQEHAGNEKSCVWHAADFSDEELKEETFCIRFANAENCKAFREKVQAVAESEANAVAEIEANAVAEAEANAVAETEDGTAVADLIEKLSVGSEDEEIKTEAAPQKKDLDE